MSKKKPAQASFIYLKNDLVRFFATHSLTFPAVFAAAMATHFSTVSLLVSLGRTGVRAAWQRVRVASLRRAELAALDLAYTESAAALTSRRISVPYTLRYSTGS